MTLATRLFKNCSAEEPIRSAAKEEGRWRSKGCGEGATITLGGKAITLSRNAVEQAVRHIKPGPIKKYTVLIRGVRYPIKQAFSAASGQSKKMRIEDDAQEEWNGNYLSAEEALEMLQNEFEFTNQRGRAGTGRRWALFHGAGRAKCGQAGPIQHAPKSPELHQIAFELRWRVRERGSNDPLGSCAWRVVAHYLVPRQ